MRSSFTPARCFRLLILAGYCLLTSTGSSGVVFKAGTARQDITPTERLPMWGYADRHDTLSTGVLDALYATALVLQCESNKIAIVSLDLGRTPTEASLNRIRQEIAEKTGIQYSLIAATHTHSGPVLELTEGSSRGKFDAALRYYRVLEQKIVTAVGDANAALMDARVGVSSQPLADFQRNRQLPGESNIGDHQLMVARFESVTNGQICAILVNFSAHPTLTDPAMLQFSSDFVGPMRETVESDVHGRVLFLQGAAGDQSAELSHGKTPAEYGAQLGREVLRGNKTIIAKSPAHSFLQVTQDRFHFTSRIDLTNPGVRQSLDQMFFPELIASYADEYVSGVRPVLTVAAVNDELYFVGVSGEFFSEHALQLKKRFPAPALFFLGYCNGYHQYFPAIEAAAQGGYGTQPAEAPASLGAGEMMMDEALFRLFQMTNRIQANEKSAGLDGGAASVSVANDPDHLKRDQAQTTSALPNNL